MYIYIVCRRYFSREITKFTVTYVYMHNSGQP